MHQEPGAPLTRTVTLVMAEGRRVNRLGRELSPSLFGALIDEYQYLLRNVLLRAGGRQFEVSEDTAIAVFPTAKEGALAATDLLTVVAMHEWPHKRDVDVSVGVHSAEVGSGWLGLARIRCQALCDAAEGGQVFLSPSAAVLLEGEDLGDLAIRDLGEQVTRRSGSPVRAFELVPAAPGDTLGSPRRSRERCLLE
jgi:class 3 adenylate cyclase